jgi:hypothetical protein
MGAPDDLSLVPELTFSPQASGSGAGARAAEAAEAQVAQAGISTPWLLIGGLAIIMLGLRTRR